MIFVCNIFYMYFLYNYYWSIIIRVIVINIKLDSFLVKAVKEYYSGSSASLVTTRRY